MPHEQTHVSNTASSTSSPFPSPCIALMPAWSLPFPPLPHRGLAPEPDCLSSVCKRLAWSHFIYSIPKAPPPGVSPIWANELSSSDGLTGQCSWQYRLILCSCLGTDTFCSSRLAEHRPASLLPYGVLHLLCSAGSPLRVDCCHTLIFPYSTPSFGLLPYPCRHMATWVLLVSLHGPMAT